MDFLLRLFVFDVILTPRGGIIMADALARSYADERHEETVETVGIRTFDTLTAAELDAKLQHSYAQCLAGEGRPFAAVFDEIERSLR
ncbi:hypothetical protein [Selenomonas sputigena]|uniref:hypothetical protein n=1 Tax=Selenomonas sputigena TaxID=69823 RepID=UPI0022329CAE|nr:hypothetical protein [Selenomonas sputigena]UZD42921.1 hypothetical protein OL240_10395 [Selenomonas sputigena]